MTPYETEALRIAQATLDIYRAQMWTGYVTAAITLLGVGGAIYSIRQLIKQNSLVQLNALLLLEEDMSRRRERLADVGTKLKTTLKSPAYEADPSVFEDVQLEFNEARENYLNSLDRLCFCILRNKFSDDELRSDYRDVVRTTLNDHKDQFLAGTPYRNIVKLHDKWADD